MYRQTDRKTDKQTDRQTDIDLGNVKMHRKKDIYFDIQINMLVKWRYSSN